MRKKHNLLTFIVQLFAVAMFVGIIYIFLGKNQVNKQSSHSKSVSTSVRTSTSSTVGIGLPKVSSKDWDLVLVNRKHITAELNPNVTEIDGISVDSRIADNVTKFLAAAQNIDASEHLISGYRSVAYQEGLYNFYISKEMAANPSLSQAEAGSLVQTYSQPAGASEHQTGLAIDMSTVDSLNESDKTVAAKVQAIAPDYGFVLRFPEDGVGSTGVEYEDWHYRYVGVESAKYMTANHITLEKYLTLLKEKNR